MRPLMLTAAILFCAAQAQADSTTEFAELLDQHWEWQMSTSPVWASTLGDRRFNTEWRDDSLKAIELRHKTRRDFLRRTYAIDRKGLSDDDQLNYELFRRQLQNEVDRHQFNSHLMPFSHRGGIQNPENLSSRLRLVTVEDFEDWLTRIEQIDGRIETLIKRAEAGRKQGYMPAAILLQRIPAQLALQVVENAEDSPLFTVFSNLPESFSADDQQRLRERAKVALETSVIPAYRELERYFNRSYLPAARDSIGLSDLPNGSAWYEFLARSFTTTRMSPG